MMWTRLHRAVRQRRDMNCMHLTTVWLASLCKTSANVRTLYMSDYVTAKVAEIKAGLWEFTGLHPAGLETNSHPNIPAQSVYFRSIQGIL